MYTRFLSKRSLCRQPSAIRSLFPLTQIPGMLNCAGGNPHPDTFPISTLSLTLRDNTRIDIPEHDLKASLQYSGSYGMDALLTELRSWMVATHHQNIDPKRDWKICVGNGSQDVLGKAFDMLLDEGTPLLVEQYCYSGALAALQPLRPTLIPVPCDANGVNPSGLDELLTTLKKQGGQQLPRAIYLSPTGQNPTGSTMTSQRKREVYSVCCKHDILILEDDPYYFLYFGDEQGQERISFFAIDTDRRVLRFDSFSKILSAGMRVGWVSGPSELIDRIQLDMQSQALHASGLSQIIAATILKTLNAQGKLMSQITQTQQLYKQRRDAFVSSAKRELGDKVHFDIPSAGMFLWMEVQDKGVTDTFNFIQEKGKEYKVLFVPGRAFNPTGGPTRYVRASYSTIPFDKMDEALNRFGKML